MKYADVDRKTARKCCKQHSYKNKHGQVVPNCKTCPLERKGKFCWYVLESLHKPYAKENCPLIQDEYNALKEETIEKQLEWDNWINAQETLE